MTDSFIIALCAWREARNQGAEGMQAVINVIMNRTKNGSTPYDVVTRPWQFSSITAHGDPQLDVYPQSFDDEWKTAKDLADKAVTGALPDVTNGATYYFNPSLVTPKWAADMIKVASIGAHDFYKPKEGA